MRKISDDELREIIANLAISQAKTDKQLEENAKGMQELRASQAKTDKGIQELKTVAADTMRGLKTLQKQLGGITNNQGKMQGEMIEAIFAKSINRKKKINNILFDYMATNVHNRVGDIRNEYDIVCYNGDTILIVEAKSSVSLSDIDSFSKKIADFRVLFPMYKDYKIYIGIASLHIENDMIKVCKDKGYMALQIAGDVIEEQSDHWVAY